MCAFTVDYCFEVDEEVILPNGGFLCLYRDIHDAWGWHQQAWFYITPDACDDNIMEDYYTLYVNVSYCDVTRSSKSFTQWTKSS